MAILIFIISYLSVFVLSMIYINPYLFIIWIFTSYIVSMVIVTIFYLLNLPLVMILKPTHPYKTYLMRSLANFLNKCYLNLYIEVVGLENIPNTGPIVAYANHKSYTDAFALLPYFPRALTLTPKKSVLKIPFLRLWLKAYDVFPIDRNSARETFKELEKAVQTIKNDHVILIFPEGTIKHRLDDKIENVKAGSFKLVKLAEANILPIKFEGNDLIRKRWPLKSKRKITIFPPIPYEQFKDLNTKEISQIFMNILNEK